MERGLRGLLAVAALVAALGLLAGCGGTVLDTTKIEEQVKSDLEGSLPTREDLQKELGISANEKIESVDCPSDEEVAAGNRFQCTVVFANGAEGRETFEIVNDKADVHIVGTLEPVGGANE